MEHYLAGFEAIFSTFQLALQTNIAEQLQRFEERLEAQTTRQLQHYEDRLDSRIKSLAKENETSLKIATTEIECPPVTTHSQTFEAVIQAAELIKSTEEKNRTREKAVKLKQENIILWDNALKERKQRFWHTLMNANKSRLYTRWNQETPEWATPIFPYKIITRKRFDILA